LSGGKEEIAEVGPLLAASAETISVLVVLHHDVIERREAKATRMEYYR